MEKMWDERYKSADYFYGIKPNPHFKSFIDKRKPGKILLPGEGEGRNAVYTARLGWDATAVDYSKEGKNKAIALANKFDISLDYEISNIVNYTPSTDYFDCLALLFLHMPSSEFYTMLGHLMKGLKPEGSLFICGFHTSQLNYSSGGPKNKDWLYSPYLFQDQLKNVEIIRNDHIISELNEGDGHKGTASLVVVEAIKK